MHSCLDAKRKTDGARSSDFQSHMFSRRGHFWFSINSCSSETPLDHSAPYIQTTDKDSDGFMAQFGPCPSQTELSHQGPDLGIYFWKKQTYSISFIEKMTIKKIGPIHYNCTIRSWKVSSLKCPCGSTTFIIVIFLEIAHYVKRLLSAGALLFYHSHASTCSKWYTGRSFSRVWISNQANC